MGGSGEIHAKTTTGLICSADVGFRGAEIGAFLELLAERLVLDFELPVDGVSGPDLFGLYHGSSATAGLIMGISNQHLINDQNVELDGATLGFGVGLEISMEWLDISFQNDLGTISDTGFLEEE
jgi:hypothetical protein